MESSEVRSTLEELGWDPEWAAVATASGGIGRPARVTVVYQDRLAVLDDRGVRWAALRGRLRRRQSDDPLAIPASGDWVVTAKNPGGGMDTVEALLPRRTCLIRQAAGRRTVPQVVAANVDTVFVVTTPNRDFNVRRVERYLAAIADGGGAAAVLLNKIDLCDPEPWLAQLRPLGDTTPIYGLSATTGLGMEQLQPHLGLGRTVAFVGSSGVGKSSLINHLLGSERQVVGAIRDEDDKGRHTTTHRELLPLGGGAEGMLIDTPGMRELQLWSEGSSVRETFDDVEAIAIDCRFRDCRHRREPGCAVRVAVAKGRLKKVRLAAFHKLIDDAATNQVQRVGSARIATRRRSRLARAERDDPSGA